jgi:hypothetical protein
VGAKLQINERNKGKEDQVFFVRPFPTNIPLKIFQTPFRALYYPSNAQEIVSLQKII